MSYEEDYKKAPDTGATQEVTRNIQSWSEVGETLIGKAVSFPLFSPTLTQQHNGKIYALV
ncbi:hypothetical protein ES708_35281 [subsurface metagenome]